MTRVAVVEPFLGGSHQAWAEGYAEHSALDVEVFGLRARHWKWRMQGAPATLAPRLVQAAQASGPFDVLLCSDMVDVAGLLGLLRGRAGAPLVALYMHENQLTFPLAPEHPADLTYAMTNWTSMLAADVVVFNSQFHLDDWFGALPGFLGRFPDERHTGLVDEVRSRSVVLPVGVDIAAMVATGRVRRERPMLLWNQRWQWDKGADEFVRAIIALAALGVDFEVAIAGDRGEEDLGRSELRRALGDRLVHDGFATVEDYRRLLRSADVVVSTARHEFFGVAVVEAVSAGAMPIVPAGLAYPELIPAAHHGRCLHHGDDDLVRKLLWALGHRGEAAELGRAAAVAVRGFDWPIVATAYDELLVAGVPSA